MTTIPTAAASYPVKRWKLGETPWQAIVPVGPPSARVIIDNDFAGDPDDLYQLVHHLLSPSVDVRLVVCSHLRDGDPFDPGPHSATNAVRVAEDVFARMGLTSAEVIVSGANRPLEDQNTPQLAPATQAIIAEALKDEELPLFYVAGGGLTDLASAWLVEPRIAARMQVIWIGGAEHPGLAVPPPNAMPIEYNLLIDLLAGQVVFNDSDLSIWQIPRNVYRQCLVSEAELRMRVATAGALGQYLYQEIAMVAERVFRQRRNPGESYALGDSPLVLLTALRSFFEADPSSSQYVSMPTPAIEDDGSYSPASTSRPMRVYTLVDTRLMFEDFYLKLHEFHRWQESA